MNSIGHRAVTVVTLVTLIYAPFFRNHHWVWSIVARQTRTTTVVCAPSKPCPKTRTAVKKVYKRPSAAELRKARAEGVGAPKTPMWGGKTRSAQALQTARH